MCLGLLSRIEWMEKMGESILWCIFCGFCAKSTSYNQIDSTSTPLVNQMPPYGIGCQSPCIQTGDASYYRHPRAGETNPFWREELLLGPGPTKRKRRATMDANAYTDSFTGTARRGPLQPLPLPSSSLAEQCQPSSLYGSVDNSSTCTNTRVLFTPDPSFRRPQRVDEERVYLPQLWETRLWEIAANRALSSSKNMDADYHFGPLDGNHTSPPSRASPVNHQSQRRWSFLSRPYIRPGLKVFCPALDFSVTASGQLNASKNGFAALKNDDAVAPGSSVGLSGLPLSHFPSVNSAISIPRATRQASRAWQNDTNWTDLKVCAAKNSRHTASSPNLAKKIQRDGLLWRQIPPLRHRRCNAKSQIRQRKVTLPELDSKIPGSLPADSISGLFILPKHLRASCEIQLGHRIYDSPRHPPIVPNLQLMAQDRRDLLTWITVPPPSPSFMSGKKILISGIVPSIRVPVKLSPLLLSSESNSPDPGKDIRNDLMASPSRSSGIIVRPISSPLAPGCTPYSPYLCASSQSQKLTRWTDSNSFVDPKILHFYSSSSTFSQKSPSVMTLNSDDQLDLPALMLLSPSLVPAPLRVNVAKPNTTPVGQGNDKDQTKVPPELDDDDLTSDEKKAHTRLTTIASHNSSGEAVGPSRLPPSPEELNLPKSYANQDLSFRQPVRPPLWATDDVDPDLPTPAFSPIRERQRLMSVWESSPSSSSVDERDSTEEEGNFSPPSLQESDDQSILSSRNSTHPEVLVSRDPNVVESFGLPNPISKATEPPSREPGIIATLSGSGSATNMTEQSSQSGTDQKVIDDQTSVPNPARSSSLSPNSSAFTFTLKTDENRPPTKNEAGKSSGSVSLANKQQLSSLSVNTNGDNTRDAHQKGSQLSESLENLCDWPWALFPGEDSRSNSIFGLQPESETSKCTSEPEPEQAPTPSPTPILSSNSPIREQVRSESMSSFYDCESSARHEQRMSKSYTREDNQSGHELPDGHLEVQHEQSHTVHSPETTNKEAISDAPDRTFVPANVMEEGSGSIIAPCTEARVDKGKDIASWESPVRAEFHFARPPNHAGKGEKIVHRNISCLIHRISAHSDNGEGPSSMAGSRCSFLDSTPQALTAQEMIDFQTAAAQPIENGDPTGFNNHKRAQPSGPVDKGQVCNVNGIVEKGDRDSHKDSSDINLSSGAADAESSTLLNKNDVVGSGRHMPEPPSPFVIKRLNSSPQILADAASPRRRNNSVRSLQDGVRSVVNKIESLSRTVTSPVFSHSRQPSVDQQALPAVASKPSQPPSSVKPPSSATSKSQPVKALIGSNQTLASRLPGFSGVQKRNSAHGLSSIPGPSSSRARKYSRKSSNPPPFAPPPLPHDDNLSPASPTSPNNPTGPTNVTDASASPSKKKVVKSNSVPNRGLFTSPMPDTTGFSSLSPPPQPENSLRGRMRKASMSLFRTATRQNRVDESPINQRDENFESAKKDCAVSTEHATTTSAGGGFSANINADHGGVNTAGDGEDVVPTSRNDTAGGDFGDVVRNTDASGGGTDHSGPRVIHRSMSAALPRSSRTSFPTPGTISRRASVWFRQATRVGSLPSKLLSPREYFTFDHHHHHKRSPAHSPARSPARSPSSAGPGREPVAVPKASIPPVVITTNKDASTDLEHSGDVGPKNERLNVNHDGNEGTAAVRKKSSSHSLPRQRTTLFSSLFSFGSKTSAPAASATADDSSQHSDLANSSIPPVPSIPADFSLSQQPQSSAIATTTLTVPSAGYENGPRTAPVVSHGRISMETTNEMPNIPLTALGVPEAPKSASIFKTRFMPKSRFRSSKNKSKDKENKDTNLNQNIDPSLLVASPSGAPVYRNPFAPGNLTIPNSPMSPGNLSATTSPTTPSFPRQGDIQTETQLEADATNAMTEKARSAFNRFARVPRQTSVIVNAEPVPRKLVKKQSHQQRLRRANTQVDL